jgi:P-type Cu2+ transporter
VLLGHWFEMRARRATDAVRALLDLAPPGAIVLRGRAPVEVPTAQVRLGDVRHVRVSKVPGMPGEGETKVDESTVSG